MVLGAQAWNFLTNKPEVEETKVKALRLQAEAIVSKISNQAVKAIALDIINEINALADVEEGIGFEQYKLFTGNASFDGEARALFLIRKLSDLLGIDNKYRQTKSDFAGFGKNDDGTQFGGNFGGSSLLVSTLDPDLFKERSKKLSKLPTRDFIIQALGIDIGAVANSMSRTDALRIAVLEKQLANAGGMGVFQGASNRANEIRNRNILNALINNGGAVGGNLPPGLRNMPNLIGSGLVSATQAFQVPRGSIKLPDWYTKQLAEQNRYQNTPEFFRESFVKSLLSGSYFGGVTSRSAVNALDGSPLLASEDRNLLKTVGLLGLDLGLKDEDYGNIQLVISKANKALKATGFEKSTILGLGQIAELTGSHRINSVLKAAFSSGFFPKMRGGMSYAGRVLWNDKRVAAQKAVMKNLTDRMLAKNFGIFDKVAYFSIANLTQQVFGDELQSEFANFDINIDPILNIGRNRFTSIIGNAERGYQEIDDRIRWIEQTNAETTGTSAI